MAHQAQRDYLASLRQRHPDIFTAKRVLEIGSLNINGTIRDFFDTDEYLGVDVDYGPGVDWAINGEDIRLPDRSFDVTISAECFEHNPEWLATFLNMIRMSSRYVVFTCASEGRPEHGTTRTTPTDSPFTVDWDYYRNLNESDFTDAINLADYFTEWEFQYNLDAHDLYFYGIRGIDAKLPQ